MLEQLAFFLSIAFSCVAWGIFFAQYLWPELRQRPRADALRPLLVLHSFRFLGLAFFVPGVVSPDLPWWRRRSESRPVRRSESDPV
jgi:hypothetical protein